MLVVSLNGMKDDIEEIPVNPLNIALTEIRG